MLTNVGRWVVPLGVGGLRRLFSKSSMLGCDGGRGYMVVGMRRRLGCGCAMLEVLGCARLGLWKDEGAEYAVQWPARMCGGCESLVVASAQGNSGLLVGNLVMDKVEGVI